MYFSPISSMQVKKMTEVYIKGNKVDYDPQKNYGLIEYSRGGVGFARITMDKFMDLLSGGELNDDQIGEVANKLLRQCDLLKKFDPEIMAAALTSPIMTGGSDYAGIKDQAQTVRNTIEVLEQIVAKPKK